MKIQFSVKPVLGNDCLSAEVKLAKPLRMKIAKRAANHSITRCDYGLRATLNRAVRCSPQMRTSSFNRWMAQNSKRAEAPQWRAFEFLGASAR